MRCIHGTDAGLQTSSPLYLALFSTSSLIGPTLPPFLRIPVLLSYQPPLTGTLTFLPTNLPHTGMFLRSLSNLQGRADFARNAKLASRIVLTIARHVEGVS